MAKIKIAVCDDEKIILEIVEAKVRQTLAQMEFQEYKIYLFDKGIDLLRSKEQFHLLLLDIEMPEVDGLSLAKRINDSEKKPLIIFITNHKELMMWGYHVRAFRYLTKPFMDKEFSEAIFSAMSEILLVDTIIITEAGKSILLDVNDIVFIESLGEGCCIHSNNGIKHIRKESLKYWISRLPNGVFIQTHRTFIVNLGYVNDIMTNQVHMKNGYEIPVSVRKRKFLNDALHSYIRRKLG